MEDETKKPLDARAEYERQRAEHACRYTHYCPRCGETYMEEGECAWCSGHVQLYAMEAKPAGELP